MRKQTNFDDDSPMHARLGRWAEGSEAFSQSLMLRRRKLFDVDKGFDEERRKVVEAIEYVVNLWTRCTNTGGKSRVGIGLKGPRSMHGTDAVVLSRTLRVFSLDANVSVLTDRIFPGVECSLRA